MKKRNLIKCISFFVFVLFVTASNSAVVESKDGVKNKKERGFSICAYMPWMCVSGTDGNNGGGTRPPIEN